MSPCIATSPKLIRYSYSPCAVSARPATSELRATIREKFDTYRFADYKEKVIDLLKRVTRVSVETQAIVAAMKVAVR